MTLPPSSSAANDMHRMQAEMQFITELCTVVAGNSELQPILDWIVQKTTVLLHAEECSIKLLGADQLSTHTIIFDSRRTGPEAGSTSWTGPLRTSVMGFLMVSRTELATADILADPRFPGLRTVQSSIRALLAVPLLVDGRITGLLAVSDTQPGREWSRSDIALLSIVASNSAGVIEKARLRVEAEEKRRLELEKEQMEKELLLARDIQMRLVPEAPFEHGPWTIEGRVIPAKQVGGDYYDYFPVGEGRLGLVIADVSGKGVPAALLVSTVQGTLRAFSDGRLSPTEIIAQVNRAVVRNTAGGKFVTLFYGEADPSTGQLRYVNAGHNYPLLRRADGRLETLQTGGVPLGLFESMPYAEGTIAFGPEDALLLFSDGITEAVDAFQQEYGDERLEALWASVEGGTPGEAIAHVMQAVATFRGDAAQNDDMTAVVIARRAGR